MMNYELEVNFWYKTVFTFFMLLSFFMFFNIKHKWFGTGFFTGLFWFWWIGLSFRYYDLKWMIPAVDILIAVFYGLLFYITGKIYDFLQSKNIYAAKLFLVLFFTFGFDFVSPFTFDWLKPEVLFVNSLFFVSKPVLALVFLGIAFYKELRWLSLLLFILALIPKADIPKAPDLNICLVSTDIPENRKWDSGYIPAEIRNNFELIAKAVNEKKDVIIFPESAFPLFLNKYPGLISELKKLSYKITVITGALHLKGTKYYNSSYVFEKGKMQIVDKHLLVPFGEYIPLPFFQKEINEIFFGGASDYATAEKFKTFKISKYEFINAICYESTVEDLYKLKPSYVVALSNDAWFVPSMEPSLQQMLVKVYAKKYGKIVYHSINGAKSYVAGDR
jgi:apolipoprotein N-acyltransferase